MSLRRKNIQLLTVLALMVATSVVLLLWNGRQVKAPYNSAFLTIADTSGVDYILIRSASEEINLKKADGGTWRVNDTYPADPNMIRVLLAILRDMEAVRNVPKSTASEVASMIHSAGYLIKIQGGGKEMASFYSAGNSNKTISYAMPTAEDTPVVIGIPGYENYVAGIFEIPANGWRSRIILNTNYRTLQELTVVYTQFPEYNLRIFNNIDFLNVEGEHDLDTLKMMNYIESFGPLEADRLIDKGENTRYDSLLATPHTVTVSVKDIQPKNTRTVDFYPMIPGDKWMLGYVREDVQMALFEARRIEKYFAVRREFSLVEK